MSSSDSLSQIFPQQKRVLPPPMPIDLPNPVNTQLHDTLSNGPISRSPLRNSMTIDPNTGGTVSEDGSALDIDNHDPWSPSLPRESPHSPAPSMTRFASSFAQRVGSLVSSVSPNSQNMSLPTEAEIEAEAEFQREQSRREAERILSQEARERKNVEERVLEMLESNGVSARSRTLPPSPASSNKEGNLNWWAAAKNKLTSGKERDLTPAQQIIAQTKAKDKEKRKSREVDVFSDGTIKFSQHGPHALSLPPGARPPSAMVGGGGTSFVDRPTTPTSQTQINPRTPSPSRSPHHTSINLSSSDLTRVPGASPSLSTTSKDTVPLYTQFTPQGTLDVPATLLTIARRFEKLEKWSVNHVRALEERMGDVEKWLVDKENERHQEKEEKELMERPTSDSSHGTPSQPQVIKEITIERQTVQVDQEVKRQVSELKEEIVELQSRVNELGQEMIRLATSEMPSHPASPSEVSGFGIGRLGSPVLSSVGPSTPIMVKPKTQTVTSRHERDSPSSNSILQSETASIISASTAMRTKLPYPTGDYTSPSPPNSPRGSIVSTTTVSNLTRTRPTSNGNDHNSTQTSWSSGGPDVTTPAQSKVSNLSSQQVSASPRARKRYTVALGQPISSSPSSSYERPKENDLPLNLLGSSKLDFVDNLFSEPQVVQLETAFMHSSSEKPDKNDAPYQINLDGNEETGEATLRRQETIGKTPIVLSRLSTSPPPSQVLVPNMHGVGLHRSPARASNTRLRTQSSLGTVSASVTGSSAFSRSSVNLSAVSNNESVERKLSLKSRTRSIDRFSLKDIPSTSTYPSSNFVDPLIVRKKATAANRMSVPVPTSGQRGRVADLRALFDPEKR